MVFHCGYDDELAHWIEAASDLFLMPSRYEPCGLNQMYSLRYGTVPVVRRTGGLADSVQHYDTRTGTGTGRVFDDFNTQPLEAALNVFKEISRLPNIRIHSVSTHLPVSNEDAAYTREELSQFNKLVQRFRREAPGAYKAHVLPSAGILAFADPVFDMVRAGIMLYGISPLPEFQHVLQPVMTWKTRIGLVREMPAGSSISYGRTFIAPRSMRVATLTAGYADGYPRHLSNREAAVLIQGRRCALLGRVTMDLMMVDVSEIQNVEVGDEVVLMGRQGDSEISCAELADRAGTITWEVTTRIASRVRRVFVN